MKSAVFNKFYNAELIKAVLEKGASFRCRAYGFSMHPFIRNGDIIIITGLVKGRISRVGRVVAYIRPLTGKLTVHRITGRQEAFLTIQADNSLKSNDFVPYENVVGYVSGVERNGKRIILGLGIERFVIAYLSRKRLLVPLRKALKSCFSKIMSKNYKKEVTNEKEAMGKPEADCACKK